VNVIDRRQTGDKWLVYGGRETQLQLLETHYVHIEYHMKHNETCYFMLLPNISKLETVFDSHGRLDH
jgi:hypothetical protein